MFFDGSIRSLRTITRRSPTASSSVRAAAWRGVARRDRLERVDVGAEARGEGRRDRRPCGRACRAPTGGTRAPNACSGSRPDSAARPSQRSRAAYVGSTRSSSGPQNGVCVKCTMRRSGAELAQLRAGERQLVVVHEHDVVRRGRVGRRLRERLVHRAVRLPRFAEAVVEPRAAYVVEEAVEQEPQHAVRHDVVVQGVQLGVEREQAQVDVEVVEHPDAAAARSSSESAAATHVAVRVVLVEQRRRARSPTPPAPARR